MYKYEIRVTYTNVISISFSPGNDLRSVTLWSQLQTLCVEKNIYILNCIKECYYEQSSGHLNTNV